MARGRTEELGREDRLLELALHERERPLQRLRDVGVRLHEGVLAGPRFSMLPDGRAHTVRVRT